MGAATDVLLGIANGSSKQVLHDYKLKVAFPRRRTSATQNLLLQFLIESRLISPDFRLMVPQNSHK